MDDKSLSLREQARELGLKHVGVSKKNLRQAIEEAQPTPNEASESEVQAPESETPETPKRVNKNANAAVVLPNAS